MTSLDAMTPQDWRDVYEGIQSGLWGPFKDYNIAYGTYAHTHSVGNAVIKSSNPKNRIDLYPEFSKVFGLVEEYRTLGEYAARKVEKQDYEVELAQGLISISSGAPQWLIDAVQE